MDNKDRIDSFTLMRRGGGPWLGAARKWLQHKRTTKGVAGDLIKWGDETAIFNISAREVEELAAEVAAAAYNEQGDKIALVESLRKKKMFLECKLSAAKDLIVYLRDVYTVLTQADKKRVESMLKWFDEKE